jgi:hypothetical protein
MGFENLLKTASAGGLSSNSFAASTPTARDIDHSDSLTLPTQIALPRRHQ